MKRPGQLNPYQRLLSEIKDFGHKVEYPNRREIYRFEVKNGTIYSLIDIYYYANAGELLGFDLIVKAEDKKLIFEYVTKRPEIPWNWK